MNKFAIALLLASGAEAIKLNQAHSRVLSKTRQDDTTAIDQSLGEANDTESTWLSWGSEPVNATENSTETMPPPPLHDDMNGTEWDHHDMNGTEWHNETE